MSFKQISLKSKLVIMLLSIAMGSIVVIGYQGLSNGKKALTDRIYEQLTSVREIKRDQISGWFDQLNSQVKTFGADYSVIQAMRDFTSAYNRLADESLSEEELESLRDYYRNNYLPALSRSLDEPAELDHFFPADHRTQYLQYHYIANNAEKDKLLLNNANDRTYYSSVHEHYQPIFRSFIQNFGFYDAFLIDIKSGAIVYSATKEADYATNIRSGLYRTSNLGRLVQQLDQNQKPGEVALVDFDFYMPSLGGEPAAFIATTIFDHEHKAIGILALQIPSKNINHIMTGNQGWATQGFGQTGEAILVGSDKLMRSDARLLYSADECYASALKDSFLMNTKSANKICQFKTSILLQDVNNPSIDAALSGKSGTQVVRGYSGEKTLVSYAPIFLGDLKWAVVAQIDLKEANRPISIFQRQLGVTSIIIASVVTFLAMLLAGIFTKPFTHLLEAIQSLRNGESRPDIVLDREDEYGQLAKGINDISHVINDQHKIIQAKTEEIDTLLLNSLPEKFADQYKAGNHQFAERIKNVSVVYTSIKGFTDYADSTSPDTAISVLNKLIHAFDEAAEKYGIEKVKTIGDNYLATCGITVPRLDHSKRCVEYSRELLKLVSSFNRENQTEVSIRIGIHTGSVLAGIVGEQKFSYDLWGNTVQVAERIRFETPLNSIIITNDVFERLVDNKGFVNNPLISTRALGDIQTWIYEKQVVNHLVDEEPEDYPARKQA